MPRRKPVNLSINHERWLVSYSDFITLLFAFFVVMYSISQVSESKYRVLSDTLMDAFSTEQRSISPIQVGSPSVNNELNTIVPNDPDTGEFTGDGAFDKTADLPQLSEAFSEQFADMIDDDLIQVNSNEFWLQIDIKSSVLFDSAKADPSLQARAIFDEIAQILKSFDNPIQVEGFTDDVPIQTAQFPSNWELSASRAAAIVKLLGEGGVAPERLAAVGYGEFRPVSDNGTEAGRAQNRRVALMIARERIERPRVSNLSSIDESTQGTIFEESQPFPQPGTETAPVPTSAPLSAEELDARLEAQLQQAGNDSSSRLGDILAADAEGDDGADPLPVDDGVEDPPASAGGIQPIELEGGGLLFTSDPDQVRNNQ